MLDLYKRDMVNMSAQYDENEFYEYMYHKQFSLKAMAHLQYQTLPMEWSKQQIIFKHNRQ